MYSRAEKHKADKNANPNLGPGCYTLDEVTLVAGKLLGEDSYAPFSALTKRVCAFDEMISRNPAPGIYEVEPISVHNEKKASLFGRSKVQRFKEVESSTPAPTQYNILGEEKSKSKKFKGAMENSLKLRILEKEIAGLVEVEENKKNWTSESRSSRESLEKRDILNERVKGHSNAFKKGKKLSLSAENRKKIVWKRKYLPPSIPMGNNAYGYEESKAGELIPRKPPKKLIDSGPAYNFLSSFAEKAKYENKGFKFGKDEERLKFDTYNYPSPLQYNIFTGDNFLHKTDSGNGAAVMALAPCVRITDTVIKQEKKKGIPAPNSYNINSPLEMALKEKRRRVNFGGSVEYRNVTGVIQQTKTPGPGSYHPEFNDQKVSGKNKSFLSTTKRFEDKQKLKSYNISPGSYEVEKVDLKLNKMSNVHRGTRNMPFGSYTERFEKKKVNEEPGPGEYEPEIKNSAPLGFSTYNYYNTNKKTGIKDFQKRITSATTGKLTKGKTAKLVLNKDEKVHIPVFGTQRERFNVDEGKDIPAPGSYSVSESFESMKNKGKIDPQSFLTTQTQRELFPNKYCVPGPGEYSVLEYSLPGNKKVKDGIFVSNQERFKEKFVEMVPSPNHYHTADYEQGLVKKTFNITLGPVYDTARPLEKIYC
ncbi:Sperm-tail PG-rich repeat-containing protein 2 [Clydaea vesicula]|uniref:Sperm-tail PG-rich repeat-containing protein 2 n=1 Tax=Clydaea vesicula TaxID=447962 RepID=A0AAD5U590_9FUNG|nr:Sperm-tail PG-rich repeat-containing protein 2 [Clydaea vesicula]